ncbi:MAG TPA: outer membrane protein assembly factor BamA, partial [Pseudomonadales bacterium]|nr:outer membrane protein assembly factor BamA [Pseudomonadales bacterium]
DIRIEGLQRISASSVFSTLPVNVGDQVDDDRIAEALKALFKTGNFQDIQIGRDGNVMVINVSERPSISSIELEGNKSIEKDKLLDGLAQSGLAQGSVFKRETLDRVRLELQRQYIAQGRYGARIEPSVTPQPRNRVALKIKIVEGEVAAIKQVNVVGNKVFSEDDLLDVFELKASHFWSFIKGDDKYSREKLAGDLENLRSYYLDHGYINFAIESTQVSITPDKQEVYITVNVHEGEKYSVNEVKLAGDLVVKEQELSQLLLVKQGQTFSRQLVTLTEDLLRKRVGNEGYTFAKINGVPEINEKDKTVNITFFVDPDRRVYVRRVNFSGNEKTRDEVMRREMRQMEGAWASTQSIELGKTRLERLGFFKGVEVDTPRVPGTEDQVDVNYKVEEQPSGSIGASVGFQQGTGLVFGANVSQTNWLGTGNKVSFGLNRNEYRSSYSFQYVNPYYTVDGVSRGFGLFYTTTDFAKASGSISRYATDRLGGNVNFGYPINENERLSFALGWERTTVYASQYSSPFVRDFIGYIPYCAAIQDSEQDIALATSCVATTGINERTQSADYKTVNITGTWFRSTLNKGVLPDRGASNQVSLEVTTPGSDLGYYKLSYNGQVFFPISTSWTLRLRT